jgi:hypothetical protein
MKIAFLIIVLLHALIHVFGFLKAFGISEMKELSLPISQTAGIFWLICMALFLLFGILHLLDHKYAWIIGLLAVILSQIIIIIFWKDAKFGTIANILVLVVSFIGMGAFFLKIEFEKRVKDDFVDNNTFPTEILTEKDIEHMPELVQRYMHITKSVGQPKVKNFRAEFTGGMRSNPEDKFMKLHSVQYNFYQNPSRYFYMGAKKMGLPATGLHLYEDQIATFEVMLLNWIKVVDAKGDKMNQGETVTLLNDMCIMAPATLITPDIKWKTVNDTTVNAVFTNGSISVSADLFFNQKGELVNFISNDRFETDGKEYKLNPWSTPVDEYFEINGYYLPKSAKLIYHRKDADFVYGEFEFLDLKYNLEELYESEKQL